MYMHHYYDSTSYYKYSIYLHDNCYMISDIRTYDLCDFVIYFFLIFQDGGPLFNWVMML